MPVENQSQTTSNITQNECFAPVTFISGKGDNLGTQNIIIPCTGTTRTYDGIAYTLHPNEPIKVQDHGTFTTWLSPDSTPLLMAGAILLTALHRPFREKFIRTVREIAAQGELEFGQSTPQSPIQRLK